MLDSLLVCNFRLFKELKINRLSRVNLFVGKNNAGKTCLLEALQTYASNANPNVLLDLVSARDGNWETNLNQSDEPLYPDVEHAFRYLFHGFHLPRTIEEGITIGPLLDQQSQIQVVRRNYQALASEDGRRVLSPVHEESPVDGFSEVKLALEVWEGDQKDILAFLDEDARRPYRHPRISPRPGRYSFHFIPTRNMTDWKVASLWDAIELTDLQDEVVACLNLMPVKIKSVGLIGDVERQGSAWLKRGRLPIVRLEGVGERLPLKMLGDGMTRLFHIILAMVNARNGFLLIDEFENGLHWTVQPKIWAEVFRLAERLNVQIFATTHSADCVRAFGEAWSKNKEKGSFHRLNPDSPTRPKVTEYTCENLSDALETDTEVR
jgi:GTPase SAR1 family protein